MKNPKVSVIMAVYNGEKYLRDAIRSILSQTFKDFEFIIVNDGSTDKTKAILGRFDDARITLINNKKKTSMARAHNIALAHARGKYIAVMDSDDISLPSRLAKQVKYLDKHPLIGLLGSWHKIIGRRGLTPEVRAFPVSPGLAKWHLLLGGYCFSHPTIMMRRSVIQRLSGYAEVTPAFDFELYSRAIFITRVANMDEVLLYRRIWQGNTTFKNPRAERMVVTKAMQGAIKKLLHKETERRKVAYLFLLAKRSFRGSKLKHIGNRITNRHVSRLGEGVTFSNFRQIESVADLIRKMHRVYLKTHRLSQPEKKEIVQYISEKLFILAAMAKRMSVPDEKILSIFRL